MTDDIVPMLTESEFDAVPLPVYKVVAGNDAWTKFHRSIIKKWIEAHCGVSWSYWDGGNEYAFGSDADATFFRMWINNNPLTKEVAAIE